MFRINFNHITTENLQRVQPLATIFEQAPWKYLDISQFNVQEDTIALHQRAVTTFQRLSAGQVNDLHLLDILSLIVIQQDEWQNDKTANTVADNLWQSVLTAEKSLLNISLLFTVHYVQYPEFYQSILPPRYAMFEVLKQALIYACHNYTWQDIVLRQISGALITNEPQKFAYLAINYHLSVDILQKYSNLPLGKTFKQQAFDNWIDAYFNLAKTAPSNLPALNDAIVSHLNRKNGVAFAVEQTKLIFDHPYFGGKDNLTQLEQKIKPFEKIFEWLKAWSADEDFIGLLTGDYRRVLRCWLGSGNYYQLENIIKYIAEYSGDEHNERRTKKRFSFWTDYQSYFIDNYLLIPEKDWLSYTQYFMQKNIIKMDAGLYPLVLIKVMIGNKPYFIIQTFIAHAGASDLVLTDEVDKIDSELNQVLTHNTIFNYTLIKNIKPVLIHDHSDWWQHDLVQSLKQFGMNNSRNKSYNTERETRERALKLWFNNRKTTNQYGVNLHHYALSYQRYFDK